MRVLVLQKPHLTSLSALPAKWTTEQNSESVVTRQNWFMSQSQSCQCVMRGPAWWLTPLLITRWWWSSLLVVPCPPSPQARPGVGWCVAPVPQCQCGRQSQVCCGVTAAHNCAHHHPHWAARAGPAPPPAQHHLSRVTQSRHSGGTAGGCAVSSLGECPAETTPTLACSHCWALPGDTVRAHRVKQTRPGPGNARPAFLLLLLTTGCSITGRTTPDHPPSSPTPGQAPGQTCWWRTGDRPISTISTWRTRREDSLRPGSTGDPRPLTSSLKERINRLTDRAQPQTFSYFSFSSNWERTFLTISR